MNEILNAIIARRSCKNYSAEMIPRETLEQIIEAGLFAASGMGLQCPIVIAVTDKNLRDKLSALNSKYDFKHREDPFYGAPVVLAVLADKSVDTGLYDGSLVIGNMMLAAHSLGIGSCWIHRAKEVFEDEEGQKILKELGIEGEYEGVGNCVLGYAAEARPAVIPRKENRVFRVY
ncbi:MAG: nitroreductase [Desulfovibrionaceae bacterium]|nr:nitroreductase [Desulfovibrionaceae bacterium]